MLPTNQPPPPSWLAGVLFTPLPVVQAHLAQPGGASCVHSTTIISLLPCKSGIHNKNVFFDALSY
jgi:hypothetical protein